MLPFLEENKHAMRTIGTRHAMGTIGNRHAMGTIGNRHAMGTIWNLFGVRCGSGGRGLGRECVRLCYLGSQHTMQYRFSEKSY